MENSRAPSGTKKKRSTRLLAVATAAAFGLAPAMSMTAAHADELQPSSESAAHGHWLWTDALGIDIAGAAYTFTEFDSNPGPETNPLNVELLGALEIELGNITLPLIKPADGGVGLLDLGQVGAISSYSSSPSLTESTASTGLITDEGAINLDAYESDEFGNAEIDVTALLTQLIGADAAELLLSEASLSVGAMSSYASKDGPDVESEYAIGDLELTLQSPLVEGLVDTLDAAIGVALDPITDALGPGGAIGQLVGVVVNGIGALPLVNAELNDLSIDVSPLTDYVREAI
ncbi:MAG TPA: choice-of-anchor G family protein, partial [Candidatus Agrococcus pullicola]|nr:choice-of-anchor G family protein [Candidatus Agrococcus pullicola]